MFEYRLQLPKMSVPVYAPRHGAHRLSKIRRIEVDLSTILRETSTGVLLQYIPRAKAQIINAVWLSAMINLPVIAKDSEATKFLGEGFIYNETVFRDYCYKLNPRFDTTNLYEAVNALDSYTKTLGWSFSLHRIDLWDNVLMPLIEGFSVLVGGSVYNSFQKADASGIVPMPKPEEDLLGGQIVNLVAFDQENQIGTFLGSRGPRYGRRGVYHCPASYLRNLSICKDFFVLMPRMLYAAHN